MSNNSLCLGNISENCISRKKGSPKASLFRGPTRLIFFNQKAKAGNILSLLILLLLFIGIHTAEADRQTCTHGSEAAPIGHIPGTEAVQELQNKSDCGKYQYGPEDGKRYLVCLAVRILHFFYPFLLLFSSACFSEVLSCFLQLYLYIG